MKVLLTAKNNDRAKYRDAAILVEPLGELDNYQEQQLIGVRDGEVAVIRERLNPKLAYFMFDVKISVRYQTWIIDFLRDQIGKKASVPRWWSRIFRNPQSVQDRRKELSVWTAPELVFAALGQAGSQGKLWRKKTPQEITPEMISLSPNLYFLRKITYNGN